MKYITDNGPHIESSDSTKKIMRRLLIALIPLILFSIYKNGVYPYMKGYATLYGALYPLLLILVATFTSFISELLWTKLVLRNNVKPSYSIFPGIFLALTLPINTPIYLIIIGSLIATLLGKMLFGGFGRNIFNPALIGNLMIMTSFGALISSGGGYLNPMELDAVSTATPLTLLKSSDYILKDIPNLWNYFTGFIPGSFGETCKLLIIIAFIYLAITKVIKVRIPIFYVLTVFVMTFIIGLYNGLGIWYPLFHILSGGLLFGAVFMATDPVTSPITKSGQVLYGICLGLLTVVFRFLTSYPEGVLTSILTMNMLVFIIDKWGVKVKLDVKKIIVPLVIVVCILVSISFYIGNKIKPVSNKVVDDKFSIVSKENSNGNTLYKVKSRGFSGYLYVDVLVDNNGTILSMVVTDENDSYYERIVSSDYISKLISNQDKLSDVNTVSGVTFTSRALQRIVENIKNEYK